MKPTLPIYVLQSLEGHLSVVLNFIFSLNIPNEFAVLMSLWINSHILSASKHMFFVPTYTVRFLRHYISGSFLKLNCFCLKCKVSFILLGPKSFFAL